MSQRDIEKDKNQNIAIEENEEDLPTERNGSMIQDERNVLLVNWFLEKNIADPEDVMRFEDNLQILENRVKDKRKSILLVGSRGIWNSLQD